MKAKEKQTIKPLEILIAEDSPTQAEQLKYLLEKHGFLVSMANNGEEALALIRRRQPAIVISDIVMPRMDGYELCRQIKAEKKLRNIPVILLTSLVDPKDVMSGLACGADNFVTKPYHEDYLLARIQYLLANEQLQETAQIQVGLEVVFAGRKYFITSDRLQILNLLLSTYETAVQKNQELTEVHAEIMVLNEQLEQRVKERTASLTLEIEERLKTEQLLKKSEQSLKEKEERFRTSVENMLDDFVIYSAVRDKSGRITDFRVEYVNEAACENNRMTKEEQIGRCLCDLLPAQRASGLFENYCQVVETGKPLVKDSVFYEDAYGGRRVSRVFDIRAVKLGDGLAASWRDVTERKRIEKALQQKNEDFEMFAYNSAHDLRTPLITVQGFAAMLKEDLQNSETARVEEDISSIETGVSKMQQLLDIVLEYGRAGQTTNPTENVPFREIVEDSLAQMAEQIKSSGAIVSVAEGSPSARVDRMLILQALNKLIQNSIQYRDKSRKLNIEIGHRFSDDGVVYFVRDNGIGISPDETKEVFKSFYRGSQESKGSGLGLTIVKRTIEWHGGRVWIESEVGKGTTVCFTLGNTKDLED